MTTPTRRRLPFGRFEIADESMSPVLHPGDYVVTHRAKRRIRRGTIVILATAGPLVVKRVIGLGGESVTIGGGVITINDLPYEDPYWNGATRPEGEWTVVEDHIFVLGDNRHRSTNDSRQLGSIPLELVVGIVVARYWPFRRIGPVR